MKIYYIFLSILIFLAIHIASGTAFSHKGERHDKDEVKKAETEEVSGNRGQGTVIPPPPVTHEAYEYPQMVETGSFSIVKRDKSGYGVAAIFTISIVIIWGMISFYWRTDKG